MPLETNFFRGRDGNALEYGQDLHISIPGAKSVNGRLLKKGTILWSVIQIDQSGNKANPDPDKITFEMVHYDTKTHQKSPMPRGKYKIQIACYGQPGNTSYHNKWNDEFEIV
jgi:hypothetical protein